MSGFEARLAVATEFEAELVELLRRNPHVVDLVRNGTEHTHPGFVEKLRQNESTASRFIRYAPDGVLLTAKNAVIHFDAKSGETLERNAYEAYMRLHQLGCTVWVFFRILAGIYYQQANDIQFRDSWEVVAGFGQRGFPVDSEGWICPRLKPGFRPTPKMSGTPYRYVDLNSLKPWKFD